MKVVIRSFDTTIHAHFREITNNMLLRIVSYKILILKKQPFSSR